MGRLLHGFPLSPSLGTQDTSAARANELDLKELLIRYVIICNVTGKLSLSILSKPGALLEVKIRITFVTSFSDTG